MTAFIREQKVGFQHCDPAGIAFYPRYFEIINATIEEWFETCVGFSFGDIHFVRGEAVPTVHIDIDFKTPSRLGDMLCLKLQLVKIGTSSIELQIECTCKGEMRFKANHIIVYAKAALGKTSPWPKDLLAGLENQLVHS
ncbi:acyl-CoA thioesterase [Kordiimonas pumila]|uniref:Acyl-CoA thioesterase n=1 Tax=Kordiimonas pumila TaxID=2161677 RepID=A0ABV7D0U9_9PROT|nr:thioesterase family protein [Kordiimonas pumila]